MSRGEHFNLALSYCWKPFWFVWFFFVFYDSVFGRVLARLLAALSAQLRAHTPNPFEGVKGGVAGRRWRHGAPGKQFTSNCCHLFARRLAASLKHTHNHNVALLLLVCLNCSSSCANYGNCRAWAKATESQGIRDNSCWNDMENNFCERNLYAGICISIDAGRKDTQCNGSHFWIEILAAGLWENSFQLDLSYLFNEILCSIKKYDLLAFLHFV